MPIEYLSAPIRVDWNLTYRCNFDCLHCYTRLKQPIELTTEQALSICDELAAFGVLEVSFGGGESILREDFFEIASCLAQLGLRVIVGSNGYLVDETMATRFQEANMTRVGISVDSHIADIHDQLRNRVGSYSRAINAIQCLQQAGVTTSIYTVISRLNFQDFDHMLKLSNRLGVDHISIHDYKSIGKGKQNQYLDLTPMEWKEFYSRLIERLQHETEVRVTYDNCLVHTLDGSLEGAILMGTPCGKVSVCIKPNGDLTPCTYMDLPIGNMLQDSLPEVWHNSPILKSIRNSKPSGKCTNCSFFPECMGGCKARAYAEFNTLNAPDPHCWQ